MTEIQIPAIQGLKNEKVLVLGESYYNEDGYFENEQLHNIPQIVRKKWLETDGDKKWNLKYYDLIEGFLIKYKIANSLVDITYYNYVQQLMIKSSGKPIKENRIINSEAFFQTVRNVQPECILVFSISTYQSLPLQSKDSDIEFVPRSNFNIKKYIYKSYTNRNYYAHWGYYRINGNLIPIVGLPHLTRINSLLIENTVIRELLIDSGVIE